MSWCCYIHLLHTAFGSTELWGPVWQLLYYLMMVGKQQNGVWRLGQNVIFVCLCVIQSSSTRWDYINFFSSTMTAVHKPLYSITTHIEVCVSETFGLQKERRKGFSHLGELAPLNNGVTGLKTAKQSVHWLLSAQICCLSCSQNLFICSLLSESEYFIILWGNYIITVAPQASKKQGKLFFLWKI